MSKSYSNKSNARRAARRQFDDSQYELVKLEDGTWTFNELKPEPVETVKAKYRAPVNLRRSEIDGPVAAVWAIAEHLLAENPEIRRRDVIAYCEKEGIATNTARTQYQAYLTALRNDEAAAEVAKKLREGDSE